MGLVTAPEGKFVSPQVCGVFLLFISGAHTLMYWGLYCHPWLRDGFIAAYYLAAAGCVLGGLRARTQLQRALPMLALFGVRFACLAARVVLNSGSQGACMHYAAMEVCPFTSVAKYVLLSLAAILSACYPALMNISCLV